MLFGVAMSVAMLAGTTPAERAASTDQGDCERIKSDAGPPIRLDLNGTRGVVLFRHRHHETYVHPDSQFAHQGQKGAECIGCHHKRTESTGVPILVKCAACHGGEGDPRNARNNEGDEEWSKRAFHDLCIGCHKASNENGLTKCDKAPVACNECHGPKP
jgi:hypothetical protein